MSAQQMYNKKLNYSRETARRAVLAEILSVAAYVSKK